MGRTEHDEHLKEWAQRFRQRSADPFVHDGDLREYWEADTRICAVLKETNESVDNNDLRDHHNAKLEGNLSAGDSVFKLGVWAAVIRGRCGDYAGCRQLELVSEMGRQLAVVNIKKTAGGSEAESSEIRQFASTHRSELRKQIELLDPEIVLGCGTTVDSVLMWLFRLEWNTHRLDGTKDLRWARREGQIFLSLAHPSYPPAPRREHKRLVRSWPIIS